LAEAFGKRRPGAVKELKLSDDPRELVEDHLPHGDLVVVGIEKALDNHESSRRIKTPTARRRLTHIECPTAAPRLWPAPGTGSPRGHRCRPRRLPRSPPGTLPGAGRGPRKNSRCSWPDRIPPLPRRPRPAAGRPGPDAGR